jgi:hypothetical protein
VKPQHLDLVAKAIVPDYALGNHTASLGLTFAKGTSLPAPFTEGAFVGQHGSWNRRPKSGYKVGAFHVVHDALRKVLERQPADIVAGRLAAAMLGIGPSLAIERRCLKIICEQIADCCVVEQFHAAIGVVDHEPFTRAQ